MTIVHNPAKYSDDFGEIKDKLEGRLARSAGHRRATHYR
jgi:hypothetical protein